MKRTIQATIFSALIFGAFAQGAVIELSPGDQAYDGYACGDSCGPGTSDILAWLNANVEGFDSSNEAYKSDEDGDATGTDSGTFANSYSTEFSNPVGDPMDATISWDGGSIISDAAWLLVKDGNNAPVWYLFNISGWDGMMDIVLTGFWPGTGAISHVSVYAVPEPGMLALFGLGVLGALVSRRRKRVLAAS